MVINLNILSHFMTLRLSEVEEENFTKDLP